MAVRLLARTAKPRKRNSPDNHVPANLSGSAAVEPLSDDSQSDFGLPRPTRSFVVGGGAYVTGVSPVIRIDEIMDLPDDLKAQLVSAASRLSAGAAAEMVASGWSPNSTPTTTDVVDDRADLQYDAVCQPKPCVSPAKAAVEACGPVFAAAEIAAARILLKLLDHQDFAIVPEYGQVVGDITLDPGLCRKLARLNLVTVGDLPTGLIVRRRSS